MFDTLDEIREQLRAGEDAFAKFKEVQVAGRGVRSPNTEEIAGEMVAFANADGGFLFLDDLGQAVAPRRPIGGDVIPSRVYNGRGFAD